MLNDTDILTIRVNRTQITLTAFGIESSLPDAKLYLAAVEIVDAESMIMKNTNFELSQPELLLLITLISDQLFRREFIDPKMPGYRGDQAELAMGKELVLRLKSVIRQASESQTN